jgi:hypothetical protein
MFSSQKLIRYRTGTESLTNQVRDSDLNVNYFESFKVLEEFFGYYYGFMIRIFTENVIPILQANSDDIRTEFLNRLPIFSRELEEFNE